MRILQAILIFLLASLNFAAYVHGDLYSHDLEKLDETVIESGREALLKAYKNTRNQYVLNH